MRLSLPGNPGLPWLGQTLPIMLNTLAFARRQFANYGSISMTRFFGHDAVVLLGAEAQRLVLVDAAASCSSRVGWDIIAPLFGNGVLLEDDPEHADHRQMMTPAFHAQALARYVERMHVVADAQLDAWGERGERTFFDDAHEMAFRLSALLMLGLEMGPDYYRFRRWWDRFVAGGAALVRLDTPVLPWLRFHQAMQARRRIEVWLRELITERREHPTTDTLGLLVAQGGLADAHLVDQAKVLFFAGFDTTANTLTWLVTELARHPAWLARVRDELGTLGAERFTYADLRLLPVTDACIKETLRLHPQLALIARGLRAPLAVRDVTIPAGTFVLLLPELTHRMPEYFADPDTFYPERFLGPEAEDKVHPFAYVGFGAGPHGCIGQGMAQIEIKTVLAKLLYRYDLSLLPDQDLRTNYLPLSHPRSGARLRYTARTRRAEAAPLMALQ